jgi:hypothetical protein
MPKIVSSESSKHVGRPGFRGWVQGVSNTSKASIRRLMVNDPSRGITQPQADKITDTHIDLVGSAARGAPTRVSPHSNNYSNAKKAIKAPSNRLRKR